MASTTRTVLVCIGERKRPVVINHDQNEKRKWFDVIKVAFADILEEKPIQKGNSSIFKEILFLIEQLYVLLTK